MIKAALAVQSHELSLAEISAVMGREPDDGYDRGSLSPVGGMPRLWASWSMDLNLSSAAHIGTMGLTAAIESLGELIAKRTAALAARGCDVVISVCQEIADDPNSVGLHLSPAAIRWMAAAGVAIDIDQYVDGESGLGVTKA
jgi:hypothetical protein